MIIYDILVSHISVYMHARTYARTHTYTHKMVHLFLMIRKNVSNESETVLRGTYFGHVIFFLDGGAKKI